MQNIYPSLSIASVLVWRRLTRLLGHLSTGHLGSSNLGHQSADTGIQTITQPAEFSSSCTEQRDTHKQSRMAGDVRLFLCGDVMLARGMDMLFRTSCDPRLYEGNNLDAHGYVKLAESRNGPIPGKKPKGPQYVWGDALEILEEKNPDARIINLECSVTTSATPWPRKGIHYRMHPHNVSVIQAAKVDCCVLANNHTADWGMAGLQDTLHTLQGAGLKYAGAGMNQSEAAAPVILPIPGKGRVLIFAAGHESSGVPKEWKAGPRQCGVNMIDVYSPSKSVSALAKHIQSFKQARDVVVLSIHWGGNWGYEVEKDFRTFAHQVIRDAGVDILHGHSSHHAMGTEIYQGKLIIYGCGDFLNDYEGIIGYEEFRDDLALMYFVSVDPVTGRLTEANFVPTQIRQMRANRAKPEDIRWMFDKLKKECWKLGTTMERHNQELVLKIK